MLFIILSDSVTYALSIVTSNGDINTLRYKKVVVWVVVEATIAYVLLSAESLKALQTASIVAIASGSFYYDCYGIGFDERIKEE